MIPPIRMSCAILAKNADKRYARLKILCVSLANLQSLELHSNTLIFFC